MLKVLVACEYSGRVREAFRRAGHDAWSCDLLPTEIPGQHVVGDVLKILDHGWDLMVGHPPCTFLANSGVRWLRDNPARQRDRENAFRFFMALWDSRIPRVALENPVGHISTAFREPDQIVQPWQFGHPEYKTTCLWLRGLPPLKPTNIVEPEQKLCGGAKPGRITSRIHRLSPGPDRWKERSLTFQGIADAMGSQWGDETRLMPVEREWIA